MFIYGRINLHKRGSTMEFILEGLEEPSKETSVWDKNVPIVKNGREYNVYLVGDIQAAIEYNELCHLLRAVNSKDTVYIHINTYGGYLDAAMSIIDAIKECDAFIVAKLSGCVASAGTMIALACDDIECSFSLNFMVHYFSGGTSGKGNEIKAHNQFIDRHTPEVFKRVYNKFLTDEEINDMIDGKDIWLDGDEVLERWARVKGIADEE